MMVDTGNYPSSHSTHTTTTTTTRVQPSIRLDKDYPTSTLGILKIVICILDIICLICVACIHFYIGNGWYYFVAVVGFCVSTTLLLFYLFHVIERLYMIPWLLGEMIFSAVWAVFFLIGSGVMCKYATQDGAAAASAFFGFLAMAAYGAEAFFKFQAWRGGEIAQGVRTTSSTVTTSAGRV